MYFHAKQEKKEKDKTQTKKIKHETILFIKTNETYQ